MVLLRRSCNKAKAWSGWGEKIHHNPKVAVPEISCENGVYHLSKLLISDYGVAVSLFV